MKPLDVTDPRARRTLYARQLLLAHQHCRLQFFLAVLTELAEHAIRFDAQLWSDTALLWDDAEKLSRYEKQQRAKRKANHR